MKAFKRKFFDHFEIDDAIRVSFLNDEITKSIDTMIIDDFDVHINYNEYDSLTQIFNVRYRVTQIKV